MDDILEKIAASKIIEGPWSKIDEHLNTHRHWHNSLIGLLSDLENSNATLPRDENNNIAWEQMSIKFLIQWSMINSQKIGHTHDSI